MRKHLIFGEDGFEVRSLFKRKWIDYSKIDSIKIVHRNMVTYDGIFVDIEASEERTQLSELDYNLRSVIEKIRASGVALENFPNDALDRYREGYETRLC